MKTIDEIVCRHCGALNALVENVCCFCGRPVGVNNFAPPYRGDLVRGSLFARGPRDPFVSKVAHVTRTVSAFLLQEEMLLIGSVFFWIAVAAMVMLFALMAAG